MGLWSEANTGKKGKAARRGFMDWKTAKAIAESDPRYMSRAERAALLDKGKKGKKKK